MPNMELSRTSTRIISLLAASGCAAGIVVGAGTASADTTLGKLDSVTCRGTSPNIIDLPYAVTINAQQTQRPIVHNAVTLYLAEGVSFVAPYSVTGTLSWVSRSTGDRGSVPIRDTVRKQFIPLFDGSNTSVSIHPGVGPLDVTVQVQPEGKVPTGPVTCVGHFTVI